MKATEFKTSMNQVLAYLLSGPRYAQDVAEEFWPDKASNGSVHGGPTAGAAAAMRLLGRMRAKGLVEQRFFEGRYAVSGPKRWMLTAAGKARARKYERELKKIAEATSGTFK